MKTYRIDLKVSSLSDTLQEVGVLERTRRAEIKKKFGITYSGLKSRFFEKVLAWTLGIGIAFYCLAPVLGLVWSLF